MHKRDLIKETHVHVHKLVLILVQKYNIVYNTHMSRVTTLLTTSPAPHLWPSTLSMSADQCLLLSVLYGPLLVGHVIIGLSCRFVCWVSLRSSASCLPRLRIQSMAFIRLPALHQLSTSPSTAVSDETASSGVYAPSYTSLSLRTVFNTQPLDRDVTSLVSQWRNTWTWLAGQVSVVRITKD